MLTNLNDTFCDASDRVSLIEKCMKSNMLHHHSSNDPQKSGINLSNDRKTELKNILNLSTFYKHVRK